MTSMKCQHCNNITTDPSGMCYLHVNGNFARNNSAPTNHSYAPAATFQAMRDLENLGSWDRAEGLLTETDIGDNFDPESLKMSEDGKSFSAVVDIPFQSGVNKFTYGERAMISVDNFDIVGRDNE